MCDETIREEDGNVRTDGNREKYQKILLYKDHPQNYSENSLRIHAHKYFLFLFLLITIIRVKVVRCDSPVMPKPGNLSQGSRHQTPLYQLRVIQKLPRPALCESVLFDTVSTYSELYISKLLFYFK